MPQFLAPSSRDPSLSEKREIKIKHEEEVRSPYTESSHGQKQAEDPLESNLRMKIDLRLVPVTSLLFLLSFIDRANIGNARLAGLEKDLGMEGYDFNIALSVFYVSYILFEIPCNMMCKWMGPRLFIPLISLCFGVMTMSTGLTHNFSSLCVVRFLLGIFESAVMPALVYYLSRWYRSSELTFRISLFIVSGSLAGAFGGLLASAILKIPHMGWLHSWRLIFVIEGMATCLVGIASFFLLPNDPTGASWLSEDEKLLAVSRVRSERVNADNELIDSFHWTKIWRGIANPVVVMTSGVFMFNSLTVQGSSFFLPTLVATIFPDKDVRVQQLLTVPPYVLGAISCVATSYASWRMNRRGVFLMGCAVMTVVGYVIFIATHSPAVRYGAMFLPFFGIFTYGALTNSHVAANVASDTARSSAIGLNVMAGSVGGLASTWAFVKTDAPYYNIGTGLNLAAQICVILLSTFLYLWIKRDNKRREKVDSVEVLTGLSASEVHNLDWKHPDFRWHN